MNEIVSKALKEIVRIIFSALLAYLGITASGCIAVGDGSTASATSHTTTNK